MKRKQLLFLPAVLAMLVVLSLPICAAASDITGHWAEETLADWADAGRFTGDGNGVYRPNDSITRAEFMALVNRMKGYTEGSADIAKYTDVEQGKWYYDTVSAALNAGYINGTGDATVSPEKPITRQEAMTIIARVAGVSDSDTSVLSAAADGNAVAGWAQPAVAAAINEGLVSGSDGKINPTANITRAESVVLMDRVYNNVRSYAFAGTYGSASGTLNAAALNINGAGVRLQNAAVSGDLVVGAAVGDGDVYLDGVTVNGRLTVRGGGRDSVHLSACDIGELIIEKSGVRVALAGGTTVSLVRSEGAGGVIELASGVKVETLTVAGAETEIAAAANVSIATLNIEADGATISTQSGTSIGTANIDGTTEITGQGSIATANINAAGVTIEKAPATTTVTEGVTANVGGADVSGATVSAPVASGGGGGGGGNTPAASYGITLDPAESLNFEAIVVGGEVQAKTVTITNSGNRATGALALALDGVNKDSFTLSATSIDSIAAGGNAAFTVVPKAGLAEGIYAATVMVSGENSLSASLAVALTVGPAAPVDPVDPVEPVEPKPPIEPEPPAEEPPTETEPPAEEPPTEPEPPAEPVTPELSLTSFVYGESGGVTAAFASDIASAASYKLTSESDEAEGDATVSDDGTTVTVVLSADDLDAGVAYTLTVTATSADNVASAAVSHRFIAVDDLFERPLSGTASYTIDSWSAVSAIDGSDGGGVAALTADPAEDGEDATGESETVWYYVSDSGLNNIFDSVYTPNRNVEGAVALFHIVLAADSDDDAAVDVIEVKGADVPKRSSDGDGFVYIEIGKNDGTVNNLPDFIIPPGGLGASAGENDSVSYKGTILRVNKGAYLNIDSDQTLENAFTDAAFSAGTAGKFKDGSVYIMAGGKVRDSAYKAWPLGEGSVFTVYKGGYLAVGQGVNTGEATGDDFEKANYGGWLIGGGTDDGKVVFGGANESIVNPCIVVTNTSVVLKGVATVRADISLMYDLWLTAGSQLTVASDATLTFIQGSNDNTNIAKAIYGQPGTDAGVGDNSDTTGLRASEVIVSGTIQSSDTSTNIFGDSTGQSISNATYTATGTTEVTISAPIPDYGTFYSSWTTQTDGGDDDSESEDDNNNNE
jgi:hypothetical protein